MRFTTFTFLVLSFTVFTAGAQVNPPSSSASSPTLDVIPFLERTRAVLEEARKVATPSDPHAPGVIRDADEAWRRALGKSPSQSQNLEPERLQMIEMLRRGRTSASGISYPPQISAVQPTPDIGDRRIYIFVSDTLTDDELKAALEQSSRYGAIVVVRGVLRDAKLDDFARTRIGPLAKSIRPSPSFSIDPRPFQDYQVESVPSVVVAERERFVLLPGSVSVEYSMSRFDAGATGNLGLRGAVKDIAEPDLIEEIKRRLGGIDWDAKKEQAMSRYWQKADLVELPSATESRSYLMDPSVVVASDIKLSDGRVLARAGDKYNPLRSLPMSKTIIVFDGTNSSHVEFAQQTAKKVIEKNRGVILVTTKIDRNIGWKSYEAIQAHFGGIPLSVLNSSLASRFELSAVPTVIVQEGLSMRIREVAISEPKVVGN